MKKVAIAVAIVVLALGGLVFLLPMAINSSALRVALADQLSHASGAEIALNGPIHFSVVPDFGVVVEDFVYGAADGSLEVTSERSVASVALLPLLTGQIQITGIELRGPRIVLGESPDATPAQPAAPETGDVFRAIAGYLENVSIDQIVVTDGEVARGDPGATAPIASDIDMQLSIPGISAPVSLAVSGVVDGNRMELGAEIGSLRDLLARQPADFSISAKAAQPLHPALADMTASGSIQLADDGSYRITGGEIDSIGQKMQLDASYVPGERPFVVARIKADVLAYSDFQPEAGDGAVDDTAAVDAASDSLDLSALGSVDADLELHAQALQVGDAIARDIVVAAQLQDGRLVATLDSTDIAGGSLLASIALDADAAPTVSSGSLNLSSVDIEQLIALAGQKAPLTGRLSSELQYAFKGMDVASIRNSLNLRGTAAVSGGRVAVPQLASLVGQGADVVDGLEASVRIEDIRQPMAVSGSARWNGEAVSFGTSFTATDLLWEEPGAVVVDLKSQPVNANFSGTITPAGQVNGKADISTPSLTRALGWLGQSVGAPLGQFAFSGGISASGSQFAMTDATLRLDDIRANGSMSVALAGKPSVTASLSVDTLDFGALIGGDGAGPATASTGPSAIDLSVLRLFDADIRLATNQLGYGKVRVGPATAALSVAAGVARLTIPEAGFYDGVVTASVTANGAGNVPAIDLVAAMENVQALPLLTAAGGFEQIEGRLKANVQVSGAGADSQAFARSLNGPVSVMVSDGAIRGIDVAGLIRNVRSLIGSGYSQDANARTEFSELSVAVNIADGVARTEDIRVLGPFVRMSGAGSVDLAAQTIDMRLDPRVVGSLDGQGGDFDVSGLGMPIIVNGPLSGPSIYPDISGLLADPNRVLQALSQLDGVGDLTGAASGVIDGLGQTLGGESGMQGNDVLTNVMDQMMGGQEQSAGDGPSSGGQMLLDSVLGGVLGQQMPGQQAPVQAPAEPALTPEIPAQPAQPGNIALPRPDPRGPAPVPAPQPAPQAPANQWIDLISPQTAPRPVEGENDLIEGLLNELGM